MKILTIGDIHCSDLWALHIQSELIKDIDKIIFLGDYVDSFTHSNEEMISNLLDIISFKKMNPNKVILLQGNHEFNYLYPHTNKFRCSGLRPEIQYDIYDILYSNQNLFQNAYQYENYIWTHAGIQHDWFVNRFKGYLTDNITDQLNNPKDRWQEVTLHDVGYLRGGMRHDVGGIFWCDRQELKKPLLGFTQVVGHTRTEGIKEYTWKDSKVYFCDCLEDGEVLTLEL